MAAFMYLGNPFGPKVSGFEVRISEKVSGSVTTCTAGGLQTKNRGMRGHCAGIVGFTGFCTGTISRRVCLSASADSLMGFTLSHLGALLGDTTLGG